MSLLCYQAHLLWARSCHLSGPPAKQGGGQKVGDVEFVISWNLEHLTIHI